MHKTINVNERPLQIFVVWSKEAFFVEFIPELGWIAMVRVMLALSSVFRARDKAICQFVSQKSSNVFVVFFSGLPHEGNFFIR